MIGMQVRPFRIDVADAEVERLKDKLVNTRIPSQPIVPNAAEAYGPSLSWVHRLYNKFLKFDWVSVQRHLNRHRHFVADVEDQGHVLNIHFTHTRSSRENAIPLILIHGWPGSFYEFDFVVDRFAKPDDPNDPAFHVIVPSCPGFCWSSGPPRRGWTQQDTARVFHKLMIGLGYTSYVAQAGDWGSFVAREMAVRYSECKALHLNFCPAPMPEDLDVSEYTPREKLVQAKCQDWLDNHLGYAVCMRSRPHTIGVALTDNPVGILMWVGEKFEEAAYPEFQSRHQEVWDNVILTTVSLYYFTNCIMTSSLPYFENVKHAEFGTFFLKPENKVEVPMGYTSFLWDTRPGTKRSVERTGNLVFYNEVNDGGHFAALEKPDVILTDCRKFFAEYFEQSKGKRRREGSQLASKLLQ